MPEQLALQQRLGHGRAVEGHEGTGAPPAAVVQGAGHQVLAGAALAGDQHRGVRGGGPLDEVAHLAHHRALAQDLAKAGGLGHRLPQAAHLLLQRRWASARSRVSVSSSISKGLVKKS